MKRTAERLAREKDRLAFDRRFALDALAAAGEHALVPVPPLPWHLAQPPSDADGHSLAVEHASLASFGVSTGASGGRCTGTLGAGAFGGGRPSSGTELHIARSITAMGRRGPPSSYGTESELETVAAASPPLRGGLHATLLPPSSL